MGACSSAILRTGNRVVLPYFRVQHPARTIRPQLESCVFAEGDLKRCTPLSILFLQLFLECVLKALHTDELKTHFVRSAASGSTFSRYSMTDSIDLCRLYRSKP